MTDLKFPANKTRKDQDFTVPLGDILARNGKNHKDFLLRNRQEEFNDFMFGLLYKLGLIVLVALLVSLAFSTFTAHAYSKGLGDKIQTEQKLEALISVCENQARV